MAWRAIQKDSQPGEDGGNKARRGSTVTSDDPIKVSWILKAEKEGHEGTGAIGCCHAPGKVVKNGRDGATWQRDLKKDLHHLKETHGVTVLICLLDLYELRSIGIHDLPEACKTAGLDFVQYPIVEMAAPKDLESAVNLVQSVCNLYTSGGKIVFHCRGGVGRAGMLAACSCIELGVASTAKHAIQLVRKRRCPQAVESARQEKFVDAYAALTQAPAAAMAVENLF